MGLGVGKRHQEKLKGPKFYRIEWVALLAVVVGTFLLRVVGQLDQVFVQGLVLFRGADSWYHMRLADNAVVNFPNPLVFDQLLSYPGGSELGFHPLLSWIIGGFGAAGFNYEVIGAYIPPVVGALLMIPIYLLGKELFSRRVGILACVIAVVLPGELFHRSLLGFTDHHILEVFFMFVSILFIVYAIRRENLRYAIAAGVSLGLFSLSWHGNLFLFFILIIWYIVQFFYNYYKGISVRFLSLSLTLAFTISILMLGPYLILKGASSVYLTIGIGIIFIPLGLYLLSCKVREREMFFLSSLGVILVGILGGVFFLPQIFHFGIDSLRAIYIGYDSPISEGAWTNFTVAFNAYGMPFFLAFGGLYLAIKRRTNLLIIIWSVIIIGATIGQRRWGYYLTVDVALLTSYFIFEVGKMVKPTVKWAVVSVVIVFSLLPSIRGTIELASINNNISYGWYNSLIWLRDNSPPQFDQDIYRGLNIREDPKYGVLTWWDYGHWVMRLAERAPTSNPATWGSHGAYRFFASQSVEEAEEWIEGLKIRYVIVDQQILEGKFPSLAQINNLEGDIFALRDNSMAFKLYYGQVEGYNLVSIEPGVKIFERENWEN
ncbi:hypothetical protein LCGC14_1020470 [marine sediment metagenome]|uniref:Dolichyl-phosphooligosaccharide-protein glycotransferase n=1 Tax=marine sediment metagenome TaxID=412755 RepID=A0A0F9NJ67_9ZZZZ